MNKVRVIDISECTLSGSFLLERTGYAFYKEKVYKTIYTSEKISMFSVFSALSLVEIDFVISHSSNSVLEVPVNYIKALCTEVSENCTHKDIIATEVLKNNLESVDFYK